MIEKILINKTSLSLTKPLKDIFLKMVLTKDEEWAKSLVKLLRVNIVGKSTRWVSSRVTEEESYAIYNEILNGVEITIEVLTRSLRNWKENNHIIPLLIYRKSENNSHSKKPDLYQDRETRFWFACNKEAKEDIEMIASKCL